MNNLIETQKETKKNGFLIENDILYIAVHNKIYNEEQIIKLIINQNKHLEYKKTCINRYRNTENGRTKQLEYSKSYYIRHRDKILDKARDRYKLHTNM